MKTKVLLCLLVCAFWSVLPLSRAADPATIKDELQTLVGKIQTKLREGKKTEADLAPELKQFDEILAQHKDDKSDDAGQVLVMKAMLYMQVLDDTEKGTNALAQLKRDYPDTKAAKNVDELIEFAKKQGEATKIQKSLAEGSKFPDFDEKDLEGKSLSVANYKGKVVLIDFWATWCGPCVGELPNVLKTYEANHSKGFEIIGISLDSDEQKLRGFIKDKKMTWQQYFDGKGWQNKLAGKYGVNSIPATYLVDGQGIIIGKNLRGSELEEAVAKAVAKKASSS